MYSWRFVLIGVLAMVAAHGENFIDDAPINVHFEAAEVGLSANYATAAVGPLHLLGTLMAQRDESDVGPVLKIHSKTGVLLETVNLIDFWPDGFEAFSPQLAYDPHHDRFIMAANLLKPFAGGHFGLAVTQTGDPLEGWHKWVIAYEGDGSPNFVNGPALGFNKHWVAVVLNDSTLKLTPGENLLIFETDSLLDGGAFDVHPVDLASHQGWFEPFDLLIQPCHTIDDTDMLYLVGKHSNSAGQLRLFHISGSVGSPAFTKTNLFPIGAPWVSGVFSPYPDSLPTVSQPDPGESPASFGDSLGDWVDRIHSAMYINDRVYCAHTVGVAGIPARTGVQWYEIDPFTGISLQSDLIIDNSDASRSFFAPSIAANTEGEVAIGFNGVSYTEFVSSYIGFRTAATPAGALEYIHLLNEGQAKVEGPFGGGWDLYSGTALDPQDGRSFWTYQRHPSASGETQYWWSKLNGEPLQATVTPVTVSVSESGATEATFEVVLSQPQAVLVNIRYNIANGTAQHGPDFTMFEGGTSVPAFGLRSFEPGESRKVFTVRASNDTVDEGALPPQEATFSLLDVSGAIPPGADDTVTIKVYDDDFTPALAFERREDVISEADVDRAVYLRLDDARGRPDPITVDWAVTGGTATLNTDYHIEVDGAAIPGGSGTITFDPYESVKTLHIVTDDDSLFETSETVELELSNPVGALPFAFEEDNHFTGTILDNDRGIVPTISFDTFTSEASETVGSVDIPVSLSHDVGSPIEVTYQVHPGAASLNSDYTVPGGTVGTLTYAPGETEKNVAINIVNDSDSEGDEYFAVQLVEWNFAEEGDDTVHFHTILDNDIPGTKTYVSLDPSHGQYLDEGGGVALIPYKASRTDHGGFSVTVNYNAGTAASGSDYTAANPFQMNFFDGTDTNWIVPNIVDDDDEENAEYFEVTLSSTDPDVVFISNSGISDRFYILDNDLARQVEFFSTSSAALESNMEYNIPVAISEASAELVTVDYSVTGGSAQGTDYQLGSGTVAFTPDQILSVREYITLEIVDDDIEEDTETIEVTLSNPSANAVLGADSVFTYSIVDDDAPPTPDVAFELDGFSLAEASPPTGTHQAQALVVLSEPTSNTVTADVEVSGGTATEGEDFDFASSTTLTFDPGVTSAQVVLDLGIDVVNEPDETIQLTLTNPVNAYIGNQRYTTITLLNDDPVDIAFQQASSTALEGDGVVNIPVVLSGPSTETVEVTYEVTDPFPPYDDVIEGIGVVSFPPGATVASAPVTLVDDANEEADPTVQVALSDPVNGNVVTPSQHELTIEDNDGIRSVYLTGSTSGQPLLFSESLTSITVYAELSLPANETCSVDFDIAGTATPGIDYTAANGTAHFEVGTQQAEIDIHPINDDLTELTEYLTITLSSPVNLLLGNETTTTLGLLDDDGTMVTCATACEAVCTLTPIASGFEAAMLAVLADTGGAAETFDLDANDIPDVAEANVLDAVLADTGNPVFCCVRNAWENNAAVAADVVSQIPPAGLSPNDADALETILTGFLTLGDTYFASIIQYQYLDILVMDAAAIDLSAAVYLSAQGDADLDTICNAGEYGAVVTLGGGTLSDYAEAALDASLTDDSGDCVPCVQGGEVWVEFDYAGEETGSSAEPFNTLAEGVQYADLGGVVKIRAGDSPEQLRLTKGLRAEAVDGTARIGVPYSVANQDVDANGAQPTGPDGQFARLLAALARSIDYGSAPADPDEDQSHSPVETIFQAVMPQADPDGTVRLTDGGTTIAVRLRAEGPLDSASIAAAIPELDDARVSAHWAPAQQDSAADVWVLFEPTVPWTEGEAFSPRVSAATADGEPVEAPRTTFQLTAPSERPAAPLWQPLAGQDYEPLVERVDTAELVEAEPPVDALPGAIGPPLRIVPEAVFEPGRRVWLPVPSDVDPSAVVVHYHVANGGEHGWHPAHAVEGLLDAPAVDLTVDGAHYIGLLVRHGGLIQLALQEAKQ